MSVVADGRAVRVSRALARAIRDPRPSDVALAAVVVFGLFLYLPLRLTFGSGPSAQPGWTSDLVECGYVERADVQPPVPVLPTPPYLNVALGVVHDRNPFNFKTPTPKPRTPIPVRSRPPRTPVIRTPTPIPTPTPIIFNVPLTLIGMMQHRGRRIAVLKDENERIYVALESWIVEVRDLEGGVSGYKVDEIHIDKVKMVPPDGSPGDVIIDLVEPSSGRRGGRR